jgi:phospholipid/cholesterol/gamma-HCH transport system ATP-binding protein
MNRRRRIGAVMQTDVWPAHMSVLESILLAGAYHFNRGRDEMIEDATELARLFALPGLPTGRRETTPRRALVRAACVRGFLGTPDLVVVQDTVLEQAAELAVPMAQAISTAKDRGGAVLWITASLAARAAEFVEPEQVLRLGEQGLVRARRGR